MADAQQTLGQFLFDYIHSKGVDHAFGIPGDFALPTFRWLDRSPIDLITMTHEPSVGFAADGYARVHGLGLAVVTYCVGGLNMLNSIACAYAEKSPVIVVSGGPSPNDRRNDPLIHHKVRTFDTQRRIFEEVTCANTILTDPDTAANEVVRVVNEVIRQCRPGYIEVPYDLVDMPVKPPVLRNEPPEESDPELLDACLREAEDFISRAKKPVILAGVELHRHGLTDLASDIAKKYNIPVAADLLSKSVIRETNPLYMGVYSGGFSEEKVREYIDDSDCVIMLGTFMTDIFLGMNTAKIERKNSILATTEKMRVGLHSYEAVQLKDFLDGLANLRMQPRKEFVNPNPAQEPEPLTKQERDDPITIESFFRVLSPHVREGNSLVCDTGDALLGAMGIRTANRRNFLSDAYYLSMGFSIPAGIGAMAADPESRAFIITGDGAFQMTGMELSTVAKYKMAPVVCILNNDGYGTQRHILDGPFNEINMWDYAKVPELIRYGKGVRVKTKGELDDALTEAENADTMMLIEVIVPREDCSDALRRLGEGLGELRDVEKKKKA